MDDEPKRPHEEYMKTLKCDCCGESIIDLNWTLCVLNPYECLCMDCYIGRYNDNAENIKENGNNYRLRRDIENLIDDKRNLFGSIVEIDNALKKSKAELSVYMAEVNKAVEDVYSIALKSDSASAIEIAKEMKRRIGQDE